MNETAASLKNKVYTITLWVKGVKDDHTVNPKREELGMPSGGNRQGKLTSAASADFSARSAFDDSSALVILRLRATTLTWRLFFYTPLAAGTPICVHPISTLPFFTGREAKITSNFVSVLELTSVLHYKTAVSQKLIRKYSTLQGGALPGIS